MKSLVLPFFFCIFYLFGKAQVLVLNGTFQGVNLYIQQSAANDSVKEYCTQKITVNGKDIAFVNATAYEIRLDSLNFKIGDTLRVEIFHREGCLPKLLHPCVDCHTLSQFELVSISIDSAAVLHWTSKMEDGKQPFIIEQFRWNKWVKLGEMEGKGGMQENEYAFQLLPCSGKNQVRIKQINYRAQPRISRSVEFIAPDQHIELPKNRYRLENELLFNKETLYELFDADGNLVRKGYNKKIDLKGLKIGSYYLNYDNEMTEVLKFY